MSTPRSGSIEEIEVAATETPDSCTDFFGIAGTLQGAGASIARTRAAQPQPCDRTPRRVPGLSGGVRDPPGRPGQRSDRVPPPRRAARRPRRRARREPTEGEGRATVPEQEPPQRSSHAAWGPAVVAAIPLLAKPASPVSGKRVLQMYRPIASAAVWRTV